MRALDLDYHAARRRSSGAGWLLLAIGLAFATDLGFSYRSLRESIDRQEARLAGSARLADGAKRAAALARPASAAEIAQAREAIQRLSTPWDDLFRALESAASVNVALLAIEPDSKSRTVRITGEGRRYADALDYVSALSRVGTLSRVYLVKHEIRRNDPQRPVVFSVSASWQEAQ
jgi:hypothetical protein